MAKKNDINYDSKTLQCVDPALNFDSSIFSYDSTKDTMIYAKPRQLNGEKMLDAYWRDANDAFDKVYERAMNDLHASLYPKRYPPRAEEPEMLRNLFYAFAGELAVKREAITERAEDVFRFVNLSPMAIYEMATYRKITCNPKAYTNMKDCKDRRIFIKKLETDYAREKNENRLFIKHRPEKTLVYLGTICVFEHTVVTKRTFSRRKVSEEIDFILRLCQWEAKDDSQYRVDEPHLQQKADSKYKFVYSCFNRPLKRFSEISWIDDVQLSMHNFEVKNEKEDVLHRLFYGNATVHAKKWKVAKEILPHFTISTKSTLGMRFPHETTEVKTFTVELEANAMEQTTKHLGLVKISLPILISVQSFYPPLEMRILLRLLMPTSDFVYKKSRRNPYYIVTYDLRNDYLWAIFTRSDNKGKSFSRKISLQKNLFRSVPWARLKEILGHILGNYKEV